MRRRRQFMVFAVASVWAIALALPAAASNFGSTSVGGDPPTSVSLGDNASHSVNFPAVEDPQKNATIWAFNNIYNPTDLTMFETSSSSADVFVYDFEFGLNGLHGWVVCPSGAQTGGSHPNRWCVGQQLRYNLSYPAAFDTAAERRVIACHELGHTVGLRHPTSGVSCMRNPINFSNSDLNDHDRSHINSYY